MDAELEQKIRGRCFQNISKNEWAKIVRAVVGRFVRRQHFNSIVEVPDWVPKESSVVNEVFGIRDSHLILDIFAEYVASLPHRTQEKFKEGVEIVVNDCNHSGVASRAQRILMRFLKAKNRPSRTHP
jgi:hypothetical protein